MWWSLESWAHPAHAGDPVTDHQVRDLLIRLAHEEDIAILVVEQNIGVATSVSDHVAIMVNGRVNRIMDASTLAADCPSGPLTSAS